MKTKQEIIAQLKAENPTLKVGNDDNGYSNLSAKDYEATIDQWAEAKLERLAKEAEAQANANAKSQLLQRLGITEDEAKLLLS